MLNCTVVSSPGTTPFCRMTYSSVISGTPPARPPMIVLPFRISQENVSSVRPTKNEPSRFVSCAKTMG